MIARTLPIPSLLTILYTGCFGGSAESTDSHASALAACRVADAYGAAVEVGTVASSAIDEASGLAASKRNPGVLYVHNDSGDSARFFALNEQAGLMGTFSVGGATAVDWEDTAVGPCPQGSCVYLGDIGDNDEARTNVAVYRVREPDVAGGQTSGSLPAEKFPFAYPDGPHNAESLMVHPTTGSMYIISKTKTGKSRVYKFPEPLTANTKVTLIKIAELNLPSGQSGTATGADIHPCAPRFLLRTYSRVYEFRAGANESFDQAFTKAPVTLTAPSEDQGEAIAYAADGSGYYTVSEGTQPALYRINAK
ncbi:hypothetical protein LZC95_33915 [Pendulispora brunnea]|uniref:Lipoprotein n=1 Tax=Pendulispora brunnea TaxID=2905690 RepID=A0ABZ2JY72_9BACT